MDMFGPDFQRQALTQVATLFGGRVVDLTLDCMTIELCAKPSRVSAFVELCRPYGIVEASRSGKDWARWCCA